MVVVVVVVLIMNRRMVACRGAGEYGGGVEVGHDDEDDEYNK